MYISTPVGAVVWVSCKISRELLLYQSIIIEIVETIDDESELGGSFAIIHDMTYLMLLYFAVTHKSITDFHLNRTCQIIAAIIFDY